MNDLPPPLDYTNDPEGWGRIFSKHMDAFPPARALENSLRYEALRRMMPQSFKELFKRNLAGENFDDMVMQMVYNNHADLHGK